MVTAGGKTGLPSWFFRNETPRATDGPEMAPISGPSTEAARRFSKITGAVVEAILRGPSRATARRPASAPMASAAGRSRLPARLPAVAGALHARAFAGDGAGADAEAGGPVQAGEAVAGDQSPGAGRPGRRAALGVGDARDGARGVLGRLGAIFERLRRGLGGVEEVEVGELAARQTVPRREAGVGVFRREPGHGHHALDQLGAAHRRDVRAGDAGLAASDEDPHAEVAAFLALDFLQSAQAHLHGKRLALGEHRLGRVRPGRAGLGHHFVQHVFVHGSDMADGCRSDKAPGSLAPIRR